MIQPKDRHIFPSVTAVKNASADPAIPASGARYGASAAAACPAGTAVDGCWAPAPIRTPATAEATQSKTLSGRGAHCWACFRVGNGPASRCQDTPAIV